MRVITGLARGRKLREPTGFSIRPTTDKIKEAIFNIVQFDIEGRRVLDLFAGTGQLGIEALSRGAAEAVFVDESQAAIKLVKQNLEQTGLEGGKTVRATAEVFLKDCGKFDLILLDPPFDSGHLSRVLAKIQLFDILSENGIIVVENKIETGIPDMEKPYERLREYRYGKVMITTYTRNTDE